MSYELIELVHVNIHEKLRCQIAERQADTFAGRMEAFYDPGNKRHDFRIRNVAPDDFQKDFLIDRSEKFTHIAFENPCGLSLVCAGFHCKMPESKQRSMSSLPFAARKRI